MEDKVELGNPILNSSLVERGIHGRWSSLLNSVGYLVFNELMNSIWTPIGNSVGGSVANSIIRKILDGG